MARSRARGRSRSALAACLASALAGAVAACTYDFDEPFAGGSASTGGGASTSSSSSSSSSGQTTGGGGAGQGASGAAGGGAQDCLDRGSTFACLDAAPAGWTGPVALTVGAAPAACPPEWPAASDFGTGSVLADPAECAACTCAPTNVTCSVANTNVYPTTGCAGAVDVVLSPPLPGLCSPFTSTDADTFEGLASNASGNCAASGGGVLTKAPPSWSSSARVCGGATFAGGCAGGVCAQPPPGATMCITAPGDQPCPAGAYSSKVMLYGDFADGRDCSGCACGNPGGNCTAQTEIWTGPGCAGAPAAVIANDGNSCQHEHLLDVPSGSFKFTATGGAGTCPATGGQPTGTVGPASPTTACCVP